MPALSAPRTRRHFAALLAAAAATALGISAAAAAPALAAPITQAQAQQVGTDAYVYGIPLMEFNRQAAHQTSVTVPDTLSDAPVNQLGNARQLDTAANAVFVQPNNDTLYTMGHLDLRAGAMVLHVSAIPNHRYFSFEFLSPYTDVFHYIGTRTTGDGAQTYVITGPKFHGRIPHGLKRISSPYTLAWLVGRTLVLGQSDLPAVHKVQNGYKLLPLTDYVRHGLDWSPPHPKHVVKTPKPVVEPTGLKFFDALGDALAASPPPARDASILKELKTVGIGPGMHPSSEHLSSAVIAGLTAAVAGGPADVVGLKVQVAAASAAANNGWFVPPTNIGDYGTDYDLRAVVALNGIAANRPAEAMYIVAIEGTDNSKPSLLNGADDYVIHFPAGQLPPAKYFWSTTMYNASFFLVSNPINRYELASHTAGLKYNADGSLDIYIGHTAPAGHESNWLPAPAGGQFEVTLRLYGPEASALGRSYKYPVIEQTN
jgi:hypothetical protein